MCCLCFCCETCDLATQVCVDDAGGDGLSGCVLVLCVCLPMYVCTCVCASKCVCVSVLGVLECICLCVFCVCVIASVRASLYVPGVCVC